MFIKRHPFSFKENECRLLLHTKQTQLHGCAPIQHKPVGWAIALFGSFSRDHSAGFLTCGSQLGRAFSRGTRNGSNTALFPAHSDRIAQDLHLIPFYPYRRICLALKSLIIQFATLYTAAACRVNTRRFINRIMGMSLQICGNEGKENGRAKSFKTLSINKKGEKKYTKLPKGK